MGTPEISIVIPTRNRPALAQVAIQAALDATGPEVEVVVADNSDVSLAIPNDPRVRILSRPNRALSMTDNWERALNATRGEWITFLSDKHRLVPAVYRRVLELAKSARMSVATFERAVLYQDIASDAITVEALWRNEGTLFSPDTPEICETRNAVATMSEWHQVIRGVKNRPQIYRGTIHRRVVEAAKSKSPRFFFGTCPDYASGLQIMTEIESYLSTNLPAVVVQVPTADVSAWSPAQSMDEGSKLGIERVREFGYAAFARYHLPPTVTSAILETLLEFRRLRPGASDGFAIDWQRYAWLATHEIESIEGLAPRERWRLHALVSRAIQRDGLQLRCLSTQAQVLVARRRPQISETYQRLKRLVQVTEPKQQASWAWSRRPVSSLADARAELAHAFSRRRAAS